jgi:ketosteroid isomerase-like protein
VSEPERVVPNLVDAYGAGDRDRMRKLLADDIVAYITNADGGVDRVDGPDAYVARAPDGANADLRVGVTQSVTVAPDQSLTMVDIQAQRQGRTLHNMAAFLARVRDDRVIELWMVDALPAYSAEFWS